MRLVPSLSFCLSFVQHSRRHHGLSFCLFFFAYNGGVIRVAYGSRRRVSHGVLYGVSVVY
jgi:hypothetical protein